LAVAASSKDRATTYRLSSRVSPVTLNRLVLTTDVPYFNREFQLTGVAEDGRESILARGRFARNAGDTAPVAIELPASRIARLILRIDDGDDAALPLRAVEARCPVPDIFVAAPAGSYALLAGDADAVAPRYELESVRDVVLAVGAEEIRPQPIEKNPGYKLSSRFTQGQGPGRAVLWTALIAAVVVLLAVTLRLARQQPGT
jgi:hypothetical protein